MVDRNRTPTPVPRGSVLESYHRMREERRERELARMELQQQAMLEQLVRMSELAVNPSVFVEQVTTTTNGVEIADPTDIVSIVAALSAAAVRESIRDGINIAERDAWEEVIAGCETLRVLVRRARDAAKGEK